MPKPLIVNHDNFERRVLHETMPTAVNFCATWCGPCQTMTPIIKEITETYAGRLQVTYLNVDESPEIAKRYGVRVTPTLILFRNSKPVDQIVGAQPNQAINDKIKKMLGD